MAPLAEAFLRLRPDVTGFRAEAKREIGTITIDASLDLNTRVAAAEIAGLKKAVKDLGKSVNVDLDTSAAAAKVAALQTSLTSLGTTNVSVDVDAAAAATNVANLKLAVKELGNTINVDLDTAAAEAKIVALQTALTSLGSTTVNVNVSMPTATTTGARIGREAARVFVQAFNAAMAAANWGSPGPGPGPSGVAGGRAGGVYAETFRTVVTAALRDLPTPTIGVATTAAEQAVRDLRASLQRLSGETIGVTIDSAQALAEVRRIRADITRLQAMSPITAEIRADTAAAALRLTELEAQLARIGVASPTARVGVDHSALSGLQTALLGSTKRMQLLITTALALGPAIIPAAAAGAAAIASIGGAAISAVAGIGVGVLALSGISKAVKALGDAQEAAKKGGEGAAAAAEKLRTEMDKLSPAGRDFAEFLFKQKSALLDLRRAAEAGFLPGLQRGIQDILRFQAPFLDFVRRVGEGLGLIAERGLAALSSSTWRPFFSYIDSTAVPTMMGMARAAGNVALGLANIVVAFAPVQRQVGGGIADLTKRFADWSAALQSSKGFRDFVEYAMTRGPIVMKTLGDLAGALVHIGEAGAPIADVTLAALRLLSTVINAIPVPILTALLGIMVAMRVASLLAGINLAGMATNMRTAVSSASNMRVALGGVVSFLGGPWTLAIAAATIGIGLMIQRSAESKAKTDQLRGSLDSYGEALKKGVTPASLESAQAILRQDEKLRGLVNTLTAAGISQERLIAGLNGDKDARALIVDELNRQIDAEKKIIEHNVKTDPERARIAAKRVEELERMRIAFAKTNTANSESNALTEALARSNERLTTGIQSVKDALLGAGTNAAGYKAAIEAVVDISGAAAGKTEVLAAVAGRVAASQLTAAEKTELFGSVLRNLGDAATNSGPTFDALAGVFTAIGGSAIGARDKVSLLKQAMDQMYGAAISQNEAAEALIDTQSRLQTQLANNKYGFDIGAASAKGHTEAVRANQDALEAALLATRDKYYADIAGGIAEDQARAAHDRATKAILDQIPPVQRNTGAVKDLNTKYGELPPYKKTEISTPGLDKAILEMIQAQSIQQGLSAKPAWTMDQIATNARLMRSSVFGGLAVGPGGVAVMKAAGGYIRGPGTTTSDSIPAWLSDEEYVHRADAVRHYGVPFMDAINQRKLPRGPFIAPEYAAGGLVRWPVDINVTPTMAHTVAESWAQWNAVRALEAAASAVGPAVRSGGIGSARMMGILRGAFPGLPLYSGFRPGSRTPSGSLSYHARDRATDLPPRRDVFNFIHDNYFSQTRELIWLGDYLRNIHNGSHHVYNKSLLANHGVAGMPNAHIHWAMAKGGLVRGQKMRLFDKGGDWESGTVGANLSGRTETVTSNEGMDRLVGALERIEGVLERVEAATKQVAPGVGDELRGTSRSLRQIARTA